MLKLNVTFIFLCFLMMIGHAQKKIEVAKISKEFFLQTDNDFLVPNLESDKNYTYGIFAGFRLKRDSSKLFVFSRKARHTVHAFEAGLMGWTPNYEAKDFDPFDSRDRPFAGWLYLQYDQQYFFQKAFFTVGLQVGTMGEDAQAGKVQNEFHEFAGFEFVRGWETQVPEFIGFNLVGEYQNIFYSKASSFFYYKGAISLGSVLTHTDNRIGLAFGRNPTIFGFTRLPNETERNPFFAQIDGGINYTLHDATLEGNPFSDKEFLNDKAFDNSTLIASFSIKYLTDQWAFIFNGTYESEVVQGSNSHRFGKVTVVKAF